MGRGEGRLMGTRVTTLLVRHSLDLDVLAAHMAEAGDTAPAVIRTFAPGASKGDVKRMADALRYHVKKQAEEDPPAVKAAEKRGELRVLREVSERPPPSDLGDLDPADYWRHRLDEIAAAMERAMGYGIDGERLLVQLRKQEDEAYRTLRQLRGDDAGGQPTDVEGAVSRILQAAKALGG